MESTLRLPRSIPEEQGIPSSAIAAFIEAAEESKLELHSFMILRHGYVTVPAFSPRLGWRKRLPGKSSTNYLRYALAVNRNPLLPHPGLYI